MGEEEGGMEEEGGVVETEQQQEEKEEARGSEEEDDRTTAIPLRASGVFNSPTQWRRLSLPLLIIQLMARRFSSLFLQITMT